MGSLCIIYSIFKYNFAVSTKVHSS
uniref:Uncharacterized protein n=1 Tax=Wuchereria bancrofti TaxID=6293 RepID=A0AAF5PGV9_WUCBA